MPKAAPAAPTPAEREQALAALRAADGPLTSVQLGKRLAAERKVSPKILALILEEQVSAGNLLRLPPATARGQPRYWDRDPRTLLRAQALELLERSPTPLTAAAAAKQLHVARKCPAGELAPVLEQLVAEGALCVFPAAKAGGPPGYSTRGPLEVGRRIILAAIDSKGPQTEAALKKAAKGLSPDQLAQAWQTLLAQREIVAHPPLGAAKNSLFGNRPPAPGPYLAPFARKISAAVEPLLAAGVPGEDLRRAFIQILEGAGIPFGAPPAGSGSNGSPAPASPPTDLIALMQRIEPGAERGALVLSRDLRRAARLEKAPFDQAVLDLARAGRLSLHRHDYVSSLSPAERDELVADGEGAFFVGMAIRQN